MGVLVDYFRAVDAESAAVVNGPDWAGPFVAPDGLEPFDGVDAKGIDPYVMLGQLVAFVEGIEWTPDLVVESVVSPAPGTATGEEEQVIDQLRDRVRDALAGVSAEQVPQLAAQWVEIEEFGGYADEEHLADVITELSALCRRAQAADEHVFSWWSL